MKTFHFVSLLGFSWTIMGMTLPDVQTGDSISTSKNATTGIPPPPYGHFEVNITPGIRYMRREGAGARFRVDLVGAAPRDGRAGFRYDTDLARYWVAMVDDDPRTTICIGRSNGGAWYGFTCYARPPHADDTPAWSWLVEPWSLDLEGALEVLVENGHEGPWKSVTLSKVRSDPTIRAPSQQLYFLFWKPGRSRPSFMVGAVDGGFYPYEGNLIEDSDLGLADGFEGGVNDTTVWQKE